MRKHLDELGSSSRNLICLKCKRKQSTGRYLISDSVFGINYNAR